MTPWLYSQVLQEDESREPSFSLQSAVGWIQALRHEFEAEHGRAPARQFEACRDFFKQSLRPAKKPPTLAAIFEPLFSSITHAMTLQRMSAPETVVPWSRPAAVITWYYAIYASVRAMLAAQGQVVGESHSAAMKAFAACLRPVLPHPLNMHALRTAGESYAARLPSHPRAKSYDLSRSFPGTSAAARGMLLQYLSGTAKWYVWRTKANILSEHKVSDFRTKAAREIRDKRLQNDIAFLHCVFRYRGKANYRDAIYLTYGSSDLTAASHFIDDLAASARSTCLVGLAFVERRVGAKSTTTFIKDLKENLRGISLATSGEAFWEVP